MEQGIILEGIHAMLEEIRDNMKKNPEQEMINSKLVAIEQVCNEFAGLKLVTEDQLIRAMIYIVGKIKEVNKMQDEKIERLDKCFLEHHKYMTEEIVKQRNNIGIVLVFIKELHKRSCKYNLLKKIVNMFKY